MKNEILQLGQKRWKSHHDRMEEADSRVLQETEDRKINRQTTTHYPLF